MTQFSTQTDDFLNNNRNIYEVMYLANGASGNIVSTGNPLPVKISDTITVITEEESGNLFAFNNHSLHSNRGWTVDDNMRPVMSFRVSNTATTITDLAEIFEYQIGNNNANQSTIVYEWYEGDLTISGASIPNWISVGTKCQYRIYEDKYSSNTGNSFTANTGILRHSGIVIGKNAEGDDLDISLFGGATPNMVTLCMKRVDSSTKLDIWFAFNIKELT